MLENHRSTKSISRISSDTHTRAHAVIQGKIERVLMLFISLFPFNPKRATLSLIEKTNRMNSKRNAERNFNKIHKARARGWEKDKDEEREKMFYWFFIKVIIRKTIFREREREREIVRQSHWANTTHLCFMLSDISNWDIIF